METLIDASKEVGLRTTATGFSFLSSTLYSRAADSVVKYIDTLDGVWIGNWSYWALAERNYKYFLCCPSEHNNSYLSTSHVPMGLIELQFTTWFGS
jgi:hypothetical protein